MRTSSISAISTLSLPPTTKKNIMLEQEKNALEQSVASDAEPHISKNSGTGGGIVNSAMNYADNVVMGGKQGHGFAAEKANHLHDVFSGKDAKLVGGDNKKDGADRLVDGVLIQTKYCKSGKACVSECFNENGQFRYVSNGKPMQIEVPSDMYDDAVIEMTEQIKAGKIKGVKNAEDIIKKGRWTYAQAKNIASFGTIEGLTYDAVNGLRLAGTSMGITAALSFAVAIWNGKNWSDSLDNACFDGICVGGVAWIGSVLTAQLGKAGLDQSLRGSANWVVNQMGPKASAWIANGLRSGNDIYGAAATRYVSKVFRGNMAAVVVATLVLSVDDFGRLFNGTASGAQVFKSVTQTASGAAGGVGGWMGGAAAGAALGSFIPLIGTAAGGVIGGLLGGFAGGSSASAIASNILDKFVEDDAKEMLRKVEKVFGQLAEDYLLTEAEAKSVLKEFQALDVPDLLRKMYASDNRNHFVQAIFRPYIEEHVQVRKHIKLPTDAELIKAASILIEKFADNDPNSLATAQEQDSSLNSLDLTHQKQEGGSETNFAKPDSIENRISKISPDAQNLAVKTKSLGDYFYDYQTHLNDDSSVYTGAALYYGKKGYKKAKNAVKSYAYTNERNEYNPGEPFDLIVLIDCTAFGSATDGFYITENEIYAKELMKDRHVIKIKNIDGKRIRIDEKDRTLCLYEGSKRHEMSYLFDSVTPKMKIITKCLKNYLAQFESDEINHE